MNYYTEWQTVIDNVLPSLAATIFRDANGRSFQCRVATAEGAMPVSWTIASSLQLIDGKLLFLFILLLRFFPNPLYKGYQLWNLKKSHKKLPSLVSKGNYRKAWVAIKSKSSLFNWIKLFLFPLYQFILPCLFSPPPCIPYKSVNLVSLYLSVGVASLRTRRNRTSHTGFVHFSLSKTHCKLAICLYGKNRFFEF